MTVADPFRLEPMMNLSDPGPLVIPVPMPREEALAKVTEQVNALATNGRGFQDGVRFADKVDAVERLARFLAGDQKEV
ncbi:gp2 [Streptomyces phage phiSASD1]|uniref:Gp2 n=1 Tax=Streptomyces phage phiSASD1 TaxID=747763 RepID=D7NW71_9CAUD|nr:gp2 [Streptomyces phage phiSASD1]ADE43469.1 gp2 [Streptomyces phage phiSASD1]